MGEARERRGLLGVLAERWGWLAWDRAGRGAVACPPFIQEAAQPQEDYQQELMAQEGVYHSVSLLLGELEDRLPDSQARDLSASWRDTTQYLNRYPNILGAHLTLAAVYSEFDQAAKARAEAAKVLQLNPHFSLTVYKERTPIKDLVVLERHIAALRKAGLK